VDCLPLGTKGSFLQVSGIKFTYSTKRPPGSRIRNIWINEEPIKMDKKYSAVMISYIAKGGDNYEFLKECPIIKDEAETITTTNLVKVFFENINYKLIPED
jgi:2',3'-cyclic-nucleotide 2'-phosphodiesterase (5'-nucleotidase family)